VENLPVPDGYKPTAREAMDLDQIMVSRASLERLARRRSRGKGATALTPGKPGSAAGSRHGSDKALDRSLVVLNQWLEGPEIAIPPLESGGIVNLRGYFLSAESVST